MTPHAGRRLIAVARSEPWIRQAPSPRPAATGPAVAAHLVGQLHELGAGGRAVCDLLDQLGADTSDPASVAACTITDQSTPTTQEHHP